MINRFLIHAICLIIVCSCSQETNYFSFKANKVNCSKDGFPIDSTSFYFPQEVLIDKTDSFLLKYFSYALFRMREPILFDHYLKKDIYRLVGFRAFNPPILIRIEKTNKEIKGTIKKLNKVIRYPFLVYKSDPESYYIPTSIVSFDSSQNKKVIYDSTQLKKFLEEERSFQDSMARINNKADYHLTKDLSISIPIATWDSLLIMVDSTEFWTSKPDLALNYPQIDGSRWIFEGHTKQGYQIKGIPSPNFEASPYENQFDINNNYVRMFMFLLKVAQLNKEHIY